MSASVAVAIAQSSIAMQMAHEAKVKACLPAMASFNATTATTAQMQQYADCVQTVYPLPVDGTEIIVFKIAFALALIGMVAGIVWARLDRYSDGDFTGYLLGAIVGFLVLPLGVGAVAGMVAGVAWLFS